MFFGKVVNNQTPWKFEPSEKGELEGEVLSITNAILAPKSQVILVLFRKAPVSLSEKTVKTPLLLF